MCELYLLSKPSLLEYRGRPIELTNSVAVLTALWLLQQQYTFNKIRHDKEGQQPYSCYLCMDGDSF